MQDFTIIKKFTKLYNKSIEKKKLSYPFDIFYQKDSFTLFYGGQKFKSWLKFVYKFVIIVKPSVRAW